MSDTDVALAVEAADLKQMTSMDIEDVYTLMDVQLAARPDARELYKRWEKQNWSAYDIDFTQDVKDWASLPTMITGEIVGIFMAFFLGEAAVTDTLSPMVHAAPTDSDRQFLSTQLVDEARHTVFFDRFFREVIGVDGLDAAKDSGDGRYLMRTGNRGYGEVFYNHLPRVTDAVRLDPGDYGKWLDSIVLYHMLVEGMLALQSQKQILAGARMFDMLPGFRSGFTAVTRDESRHVNYGVYALYKGIEAGYHDRIVETTSSLLDSVADVNSYTNQRIPVQEGTFLAQLEGIVPEGVDPQSLLNESASFPISQLRKRLRAAGVRPASLEALEAQWYARREANFDEYEATFGEPHPVRVRRAAQA